MPSKVQLLNILTDLRDPTSSSHYLALEGLVSKVRFRDTDKQSQIVVLNTDAEDSDIEPVVFSIVGQVSPVGSYLQAYGSYIRNSKMEDKDDWRTAAKIKVVVQPITNAKYADVMGSDWQKFAHFINEVHPLAFNAEQGKKNPTTKTSPLRTDGGLLFQHTLLVPRDANDNDEDLEGQFTIEGWPVYGEYRTELDQFIPTHKIEPLPAVSVTGCPIDPKQYASQLNGAIVKLDFTLQNWNIKSSSKGALVANIECITVLVPPVTHPSSPSKKRFRDLVSRKPTHDMPESPTKKGKLFHVNTHLK